MFAALWYFGRWERNKLKMSISETSWFKHFIFCLTLVALGLSPVIQQHLRTLYTHEVVIHWCTSRDHIFGSQEISNEWWHVIDSQTPSLSLAMLLSNACSSVQFLFCSIYYMHTQVFLRQGFFKVQGVHLLLHLSKTSEAPNANRTYCSVFSKLAEWGEGFLVSFSDLLSKII